MVQKKLATLAAVVCISGLLNAKGKYISGDFHQHTTYTDGSYSFGYMMKMNNFYGLDWWANSEHGGAFNRYGKLSGNDLKTDVFWSELTDCILLGKENSGKMWRWQSLRDYSFMEMLESRQEFPNKIIMQGLEWNVPGHEHGDVCIINNQFDQNPNCNPLAEFEYKFDDNDFDNSDLNGWKKSTATSKRKTLEAIAWLQNNYPTTSWFLPTHPENAYEYEIDDLRNFNNAGPDVCFGFDGQPGHQRASTRGSFDEFSYGATTEGATWGGTGAFAAKIGGVWDALLSEGRNWWLFANSDCHSPNDFFPGQYQRTKTFVTDPNSAQAIVVGLRSGNSYIVMGDLIDSLSFTIEGKQMGETYTFYDKNSVNIEITVHDPETNNYNTKSSFTNPKLDHIDIIAGTVKTKIDPNSPEYKIDTVSTTSVIARFGNSEYTDSRNITTQLWTDLGNGYKKINFQVPVNGKMYFRLRGTHHAFSAIDTQIDSVGNPLIDPFGKNNYEIAFEDLWFYSNPIFLEKKVSTEVDTPKAFKMQVFPNPTKDFLNIYLSEPQSGKLKLIDMTGKYVLKLDINNEKTKQIPLNNIAQGVYTLQFNNQSTKVVIE